MKYEKKKTTVVYTFSVRNLIEKSKHQRDYHPQVVITFVDHILDNVYCNDTENATVMERVEINAATLVMVRTCEAEQTFEKTGLHPAV